MSIDQGKYLIRGNTDSDRNFVGTGPVPPIYPPPDSPLRGVPAGMKDLFTVRRSGDSTYTLNIRDRVVGYYRDNDMVMVKNGEPQDWAIEPAGGDRYYICVPDADLCWTLSDDEFAITLKPRDGRDNQLWTFIRLFDD
ncbi:hypothetical protein FS749_006986 [Ceratobasidium sp. UAMH 11750]|nr:hypothetical protein FS749_006986 [Ceratobasidium sp. UAMH 11750]